MAERSEVLGIRIKLEVQDFQKQLDNITKAIAEFGGSIGKSVEQGVKASKTQLKMLADHWGTTTEEAKKRLQENYDSKHIQKFIKEDIELKKQGINAEVAARKQATEEVRKAEEKLGNDTMAVYRNTRKAAVDSLKEQIETGNKILAIQKNTKASDDARLSSERALGDQILAIHRNTNRQKLEEDRRAAAEQQRIWNAIAGTQGVKYQQVDGGGFVRATVQTQNLANAMGRLQAEAIRTNTAMSGSVRQTDVLSIALGRLTTRIAEFYSIRTVMFAIANQIRDAVSGAISFHQSMHDIAAISGASEKEMLAMGDSILNIAKNSKYSAAEVANLMQILAQAGVAAKDMEKVSTAVGMFATATGATPQQASDVVTTTLNVWEKDASETVAVTNALAAALNNSKLEVGGLSTAFNYLASQAAIFGYSVEETLGVVSALSQIGIKPSTIGTGVSQLWKELAAPKDRLKRLLDEYKISINDINPQLRSHADIVQVFADKNVASEKIMRALDTRVARSLIASIKAGADSFRVMTESVTGTDAALVAYYKTMDGAEARMNVIKQTFMSAVTHMGNSVSPVLSKFSDALLDVVRGLDTFSGRVVVAAAGVMALGTAFVFVGKALQAHPWYLALSVGIAAVTFALGQFGAAQNEEVARSRELSRELAKEADARQRLKDAIVLSKIEAESNNASFKNYAEVVKKYGENSDQAREAHKKLGDQTVTLKEETKRALLELKPEYGEYLDNIDLENTKYTDLLSVLNLVNSARGISIDKGIADYNRLIDEKKVLESALKDYQSKLADANKDLEPGRVNLGPTLYYKAKIANAEDQIRQVNEQIPNALGHIPVNEVKDAGNGHIARKTQTELDADEADRLEKQRKAEADRRATAAEDALKQAQDRLEKKFRNALYDSQQRTLGMARAADKENLALLEKSFSDPTLAIEQKRENLAESLNLLGEIVDAEIQKELSEIDQRWQNLTEEADAQKISIPVEVELAFKAERQAVRDRGVANLRKELADLQASFSKGTNTTSKSELVGEIEEKRADRTLITETSALNLQKQRVWTGDDLLKIQVKLTDAEMRNLETKRAAFEQDLTTLQLKQEAGKLGEKDQAYLDSLPAKLQSINDKYRELVLLRNQQTDTDFFNNLEVGAKKSVQALGSFQSNTQALGETLTSTLGDGMQGVMNNMIDSLERGENAWKSFREGVGDLLSQLAQEIQKYIVKLMVMWAIQKLVGIAAGGGGGEAMAGMPDTSIAAATGATGGFVTSTGIQKFANGGIVLIGTSGGQVPLNIGKRGQDSVPTILMPGEFVVREDAVNHYGVDFFKKLNAKQLADGGIVEAAQASKTNDPTGSKKDGEKEATLNIINVVDPRTIPKTTGEEILNILSFEAAKNGPVFKQWKSAIRDG